MKTGIERIADERKRQIDMECWTPERDNMHVNGELAQAAAHYLAPKDVPWPWELESDKSHKHDYERRLEIAGALCAAELDRLARKK